MFNTPTIPIIKSDGEIEWVDQDYCNPYGKDYVAVIEGSCLRSIPYFSLTMGDPNTRRWYVCDGGNGWGWEENFSLVVLKEV